MSEFDTAYNYNNFNAHTLLAAIDPDITQPLSITTKVGFFPDGHDLTPVRLTDAAHRTVSELGRAPDTLLLHNPERSPAHFTQACETLVHLRNTGLCHAWGISSWNPRPLLDLPVPEPPDVLMVRCGLTVPIHTLEAAEATITRWRPREVRGMAPFGGSTRDPVWRNLNPAIFLSHDSRRRVPTTIQSALAAAFALPSIAAIAVGMSSARHLEQLQDATALHADPDTVARYRRLLAHRHTLTEKQSTPAKETSRA